MHLAVRLQGRHSSYLPPDDDDVAASRHATELTSELLEPPTHTTTTTTTHPRNLFQTPYSHNDNGITLA